MSSSHFKTSFIDLADEIIIRICDFLTIRDRLTFRRVCRRSFDLSLRYINEFSVGSNELEYLDRHLPMTNHFISGDEIKRLQVLNLVLKEDGPSLRKLQLSSLEQVKYPSQKPMATNKKPAKFEELCFQMEQLLTTNCPKLEVLIFDYKCRLKKKTFQYILDHLGHQLKELYFGDLGLLHLYSTFKINSYLNPDRIQKLVVMLDQDDDNERQNLFKFQHLTSITINQADIGKDCPSFWHTITSLSCRSKLSNYESLAEFDFWAKLDTLRIEEWKWEEENNDHDFIGHAMQVPNWLRNLPCLQNLSLQIGHPCQIVLLVNNLPTLKNLALIFHSEGHEKAIVETLLPQILKLKNLQTLRINWLSAYIEMIDTQLIYPHSQITFFELKAKPDKVHSCNEISLLKTLHQIFPNLEHLDIQVHHDDDFHSIPCVVRRFEKLKRFRLLTCQNKETSIQNELISFFDQQRIQLHWKFCCESETCVKFKKVEINYWANLHNIWRI